VKTGVLDGAELEKGIVMKKSLMFYYERTSHLASSKERGKSLSAKYLIIKGLEQNHQKLLTLLVA